MRLARLVPVPGLMVALLAVVVAACQSASGSGGVVTAGPRSRTRTGEPTVAPTALSPISKPTAAPSALVPGAPANGSSACARISADGRHVAFMSRASNLVAGDRNGAWDVFVRDRLTGQTERVSVATGGGEANDGGSGPAISADGRWVAFESTAANLVPGDTNGTSDVFVHDREAGITELVSVGMDGRPAGGASLVVALSADGRYVTFASTASNLVTGPVPGEGLAYYTFDRETHTVRLGEAPQTATEVSADGRWELYAVVEPNPTETPGPPPTLAPGVPPSWTTLYLRERQSGEARQIARFLAPWRGGALCATSGPGLSADGRWVAYMAPGEQSPGTYGIFLYDRDSGTTRPVTARADWECEDPSISADGRYVAFTSLAQDPVLGLPTAVYVYDRETQRGEASPDQPPPVITSAKPSLPCAPMRHLRHQ